MTHSAAPTLYTDHWIALTEDVQLDSLLNAPFETVVHVLLPVLFIEIGFPLREQERVDASIEMGILYKSVCRLVYGI